MRKKHQLILSIFKKSKQVSCIFISFKYIHSNLINRYTDISFNNVDNKNSFKIDKVYNNRIFFKLFWLSVSLMFHFQISSV